MTPLLLLPGRPIGVRDLRQHVARVLREVGETGPRTITSQGQPIARLEPLREPTLIGAAQFDALVAATPDTDHRIFELIRGEISVSPSPTVGHQYVSRMIANAIAERAEPEHLVVQDWTWRIDDLTTVRPDIVVCDPPARMDQTMLTTPPLLVVEITSTNRVDDLVTKRELYARAGVASYWILDTRERVLLTHQLADGGYPAAEVARFGRVSVETSVGIVELNLDTVVGFLR